jgi:hypothetical protein
LSPRFYRRPSHGPIKPTVGGCGSRRGDAARNPFRTAVRTSLKAGLLDAEQTEKVLAMIDDRNLTVHLYREAVAEQIWEHIPRHAELLSRWIDAMRSRVETA